jgi:hypothetical protein
MSIETKKLSDMALLAELAYSDLVLRDYKLAPQKGVSVSQIDYLKKNYQIIEQQPNTGSGFSGALFKRIGEGSSQGEYVFATRGTELGAQFGADLAADLGDLVFDGLAWEQIVDMYNFWKRLITPIGQSYQMAVIATPLVNLNPNAPGIRDKGPASLTFRTIEFQSASDGLGLIAANAVVDVTGHSLGGHLSSAFSRLFPANTNASYGMNGAGYAAITGSSNIEYVFSRLGGASTFDSNVVETLYGTAGPNIVSQNFGLVQVGRHDPLFSERGGVTAPFQVFGHSGIQMNDSAAVYDIFIRLDRNSQYQSPSMFLPRFLPIFENAASSANRSLEVLPASLNSMTAKLRRTIGRHCIHESG